MKSSNKRIAKNTLLLYFRTLLTMGVSLFTVRIVLDVLGVVDYGLYNVVGGIVTMFGFLSGSMASATQRFFSYELGKKNFLQLKKIFSLTVLIYLFLAVLVLILAETIGLWFLNNKMSIPNERREAAQWVYQLSIVSFLVTMLTVPYNAIIIAREKMSVYAYVSIVDVILKLLIVYVLVIYSHDKLVLYALLTLVVTIVITMIYRIYCKNNFEECHFTYYWDREMFKEITSYSGWNLFGALASVLNNQGINILLNIFFGPVINTSRAIAYRVNNAVNQFVLNFMTASRPQIVKSYANGNKEEMLKLIFQSSKYSFLLLYIISLPVIIGAEDLLSIWLKDTPEMSVTFLKLTLVSALIDSMSYPLMTAAQATGRIKMYQIIVGGVMLLAIPISYIVLKIGYQAQTIFIIAIITSVVTLFLRLFFLKNMIGVKIHVFTLKVLLPVVLVGIFSWPIPYFLNLIIEDNIIRLVCVFLASFIVTLTSIYLFGINKNDRNTLLSLIRKKINFK